MRHASQLDVLTEIAPSSIKGPEKPSQYMVSGVPCELLSGSYHLPFVTAC
jgi:hypothetical protein